LLSKIANEILTTAIIVLAMVLLAFVMVRHYNSKQAEVIDAIKQAQQQRINATLEAIRERLTDEQWQEFQNSLNGSKSVR